MTMASASNILTESDPVIPAPPVAVDRTGLRVVFVSFDIRSRFGGIQRFDQRVVRCLRRLRDSGADVRVLSLRDAKRVAADADTPLEIHGAKGGKAAVARKFISALLRTRPDMILYGHVLLAPLALVAKIIAPRAKNVMFAHGVEVWDDPDFARVSRINKLAVRRGMDQVLAVSRYTANRLKRVFGLDDRLIRIFPNAVDVMSLTESPARDARSGQVHRLLTVARLDEWGKGVGAVIRALPLVIPRVGKVEYTIVGDGRLRADMQALARKIGVEGSVRFTGKVSDAELMASYREADAFVMPSLKEGFGIVYLEAWQHGLPVIAGDRDAGSEVVEHNRDGLVVDPTSTQQIADAIVRLLQERTLAARLGAAGREKLVREYSHERFAERFESVIEALAGIQGGPETLGPETLGPEPFRPERVGPGPVGAGLRDNV